ncbi:MAG: exodeoxyribonuclease VII small subunit, partial [Acidobacteriaceae bacterium]|nr:exodeoxyribonuclease VII small subunit [Acidobacteriaceae bacterium]
MGKFEEDLAELEKVVEQLERGELSLEDSVGLFERGVLLSRSCKTVLGQAEARLQALIDPENGDDEVRTEDIAVAVGEESPEENEDLDEGPGPYG